MTLAEHLFRNAANLRELRKRIYTGDFQIITEAMQALEQAALTLSDPKLQQAAESIKLQQAMVSKLKQMKETYV